MRGIGRLWAGSHDETERNLSEHLEGELHGLRRRRVLRHLARCEPCAAAFRSLRRTVEGLHALGFREPAPGRTVAVAVVVRIRLEQERER